MYRVNCVIGFSVLRSERLFLIHWLSQIRGGGFSYYSIGIKCRLYQCYVLSDPLKTQE